MSSNPTRIITREQQGVKVIKDQEAIDKLFDKNYEPIIIILRDGPLTIKELHVQYNNYIKLQGKQQSWDKDEIESRQKSEMTLYRYIKDLGTYDIVSEVGKIITTGQSATETLYGRTAKIFWNLKLKEDYWTSDPSWTPESGPQKMLETLRGLLVLYTKNTKITTENLAVLLTKTANTSSQELATFFEENNDQIGELITGYSFKDIDKVFDILGNLILIMNSAAFEEDLEKCGC